MSRWEKAAHSHRRVFVLPSQLGSTQLLCPVAFLIEFIFLWIRTQLFPIPLFTKNNKSERYRGSLMACFKCMFSVTYKRKACWPIAEGKVFSVKLTEWWGEQLPCSVVLFLSPGLHCTETWSSFVPQLVYCSWCSGCESKVRSKEKTLQPHSGKMTSVYAGMSKAFL